MTYVDDAPPPGPAAGARRQSWSGPCLGAVVGAAFLVWLAGGRLLDPTEIGWAMKFDWLPHYFGWYYFRVEPWHWPPGHITGYYAPYGSAIGLTDALPLAAYLLKPFSPWLPAHVQYLSLWWLLCFTLQGALAARLVGRWLPGVATQVLGATLFVLLPALLARVAHAALCSHWLLLWALLIATRAPDRRLDWREWMLVGILAGLIQPYLAAMTLALLAAVVVATPATWSLRAQALGAALATTAIGWWLSGLFTLSESGSLSAFGLGFYSMNLLAFVTPSGWSRVMPSLPHMGPGQEAESFHYLGLGILALLVVAGAVRTTARRGGALPLWPRAVVAICVLMTAFAVSPRVTFGDRVLVDIGGAWSTPLAIFRSSGRFAWPLTYLVLTWAIVAVGRRFSTVGAGAVLALAIVAQVADVQHVYADRRRAARDPRFFAWENPFVSPRWSTIAAHYRHLVWAPPAQCRPPWLPMAAVIRFAAEHGLTVNTGVLSRGEELKRARYCEQLAAEVAAGRLAEDSLYLVPDDDAAAIQTTGANVCGRLDGVTLCTASSTHAAWRHLAPLD